MRSSSCKPTHFNLGLIRNADLHSSPGDYLPPDMDEIAGFKSRLNERLAPVGSQFSGDSAEGEWDIADTLAQWFGWRTLLQDV